MQKFSRMLKSVTAAATLAVTFAAGWTTLLDTANAQKQTQKNNTTAAAAPAAAFTAGNVVVYRVGNGTETLVNTGNTVFLDEYTPAGTLVQSIALPTTVSGTNRQLIASGTATSEGLLTRSTDGRFLLLTGYARNLGGTGTISGTTATDVNRVVGRVDVNGAIDTSTALTESFSATNIRSAVSTNGTDLWVTGGNGGVRYTTLSATTATQINTGANPTPQITNFRQINIFNNQLSYSTGSGTNPRVGNVGTGTPTTPGQDLNFFTGVPGNGSPYAYFLADLSAAVAGVDTLYIADDTTATGGIQKYSLVGGTWTANGVAGAGADAYRGITGVVNGTSVTLYATRKGGSAAAGGGELVSLVDATGYNTTITATAPTLLATAAASTAFRGVALTPASGGTTAPSPAVVDFDGDGRTDYVTIGTRSTGLTASRRREKGLSYLNNNLNGVTAPVSWFVRNNASGAQNGVQWGLSSDVFVPEDYDGDDRDDYAVWRPAAAEEAGFYILQSQSNTFRFERFGAFGDDPTIVGDFDGDGTADPAVFRTNANGAPTFWFYRPSATPATQFVGVQWGIGTDVPVSGDFDNDNKNDFAVQRNQGGLGFFYILKSNGGVDSPQWGLASDFVVPGDYDGDGRSDLCVSRSNGTNLEFFILESDGGTQFFNFGAASDIEAPGDYNGDGRTDIGVWRPGNPSVFFVRPAGVTGQPDIVQPWGVATDFPAANYNVQ